MGNAQLVGPTPAQLSQQAFENLDTSLNELQQNANLAEQNRRLADQQKYTQASDVMKALVTAYNGDYQKLSQSPEGEAAIRNFLKISGKSDADTEAYVHAFKTAPANALSTLTDATNAAIDEMKNGKPEEGTKAAASAPATTAPSATAPAAPAALAAPAPTKTPSVEREVSTSTQGAQGKAQQTYNVDTSGVAKGGSGPGANVQPGSNAKVLSNAFAPTGMGLGVAGGVGAAVPKEMAPVLNTLNSQLPPAQKAQALQRNVAQAVQGVAVQAAKDIKKSGGDPNAFLSSFMKDPDILNAIAVLNPNSAQAIAAINAQNDPMKLQLAQIELQKAEVALAGTQLEADIKAATAQVDANVKDAQVKTSYYESLAAFYRMQTAMDAVNTKKVALTPELQNALNSYTNAINQRNNAIAKYDMSSDPVQYAQAWNTTNALVTAYAKLYNGLLGADVDSTFYQPTWADANVQGLGKLSQGLAPVGGMQPQTPVKPYGQTPLSGGGASSTSTTTKTPVANPQAQDVAPPVAPAAGQASAAAQAAIDAYNKKKNP